MNTHRSSSVAIVSCLTLLLFSIATSSVCQEKGFGVCSLITDNMVLQQRSDVQLWGWGMPGVEVQVWTSWGRTVSTRVTPDRTWMLKLHTPEAGGPYELVIVHRDTTLTIRNVMVGEVWLCSGQSNMEMPLEGWPPGDTILNFAREIEQSLFPNIRLFTVRRAFSAKPELACTGAWVECSPSSSPSFSATAYFFGKKLHEALGVPVGLIHASWGGTAVNSWISARFLSRVSAYDTILQKVRACADGQRRILDWLHQYEMIDMDSRKGESRWRELSLRDEECPSRSYNDSAWDEMKLPVVWEATDVGNLDGAVWFRKELSIPADWIHRDLVLELGPIDDIDVTYVNGVKVGSHEGEGLWKAERVYRVPATVVDSSNILIAVRVIDYQGGGGIYGDPKSVCLHPEGSDDRMSLAGDWKYLPVAQLLNNVLYVFGANGRQYEMRPRLPIDLAANTPTALYNGMISPVIPYSIRGVIWYQGESDAGNPKAYKGLFPLLIENWRDDFMLADFPFYYAQIAPFEYDPPTQSQYLREAQLAALRAKNTGMAVTLDIGNSKNIHPANKQDVGTRLAFWALAKTYGKKLAYSGPLYRSLRKGRGTIELFFDHAGKGLVLRKGTTGNGFQIAGADRLFKEAIVKVRGSKLVVSHPDIAFPQAVRYAFNNTPQATLFNKEGLPASSFRTDEWE